MGIQVASEDLCSEQQWTVCKALATFVAHQQLSKVADCPAVRPQALLSAPLRVASRSTVPRRGVGGGG